MTVTDANTTRRAEVDTAPEGEQPGPLELAHAAVRLPASALAGDCGDANADRSSPAHRKAALLSIVDHAGASVWAMHVATIAGETGHGERTTRRALAWLERAGWIARERMHRDDGRPGIYAYRANVEAIVAASPSRARARGTGPADRSSPVQRTAREGDQSAGGPSGLGPVPSNPPGSGPTPRSGDVDGGGVFADADEPSAGDVDAEPPGPEPVDADPAAAAPPSEPSGDGPAGDRQSRQPCAAAAAPEPSGDDPLRPLAVEVCKAAVFDVGGVRRRPADPRALLADAACREVLAAYLDALGDDLDDCADHVVDDATYADLPTGGVANPTGFLRSRVASLDPDDVPTRARPAHDPCDFGRHRWPELDTGEWGDCLGCGQPPPERCDHPEYRAGGLDAAVGRCLGCGTALDAEPADVDRGRP